MEEVNKVNSYEDYNNQGIDVIATSRKDDDDCILNYLKDEIQKNTTLVETTRTAERIGYETEGIIKKLKEKVKQQDEIRVPKTVDANAIRKDMAKDSRTMEEPKFIENFENLVQSNYTNDYGYNENKNVSQVEKQDEHDER